MQLSYWEKESFFNNTDICIIGSGIVGLSAAIECRRKYPDQRVLVLERGFLPYGASTRNAGFACFGSVTELNDDLKNKSLEDVVRLAVRRYKGLLHLRELLGDDTIGYENNGGYEIFNDTGAYEEAVKMIPLMNDALGGEIGQKVYREARDICKQFEFSGIELAIFNQYEAQVNTGKMMAGLLQLARKHGVEILNGIGVLSLNDGFIQTDKDFSFRAGKTIVTVNGFAQQLIPELPVEPARAQVVVTSPVKGLPFRGTFHYDKGYYYFRNLPDNRVLFGGGRNLDFESERSFEMKQTSIVMEKLQKMLRENILPGKKFTIDMQWSGIMGVGEAKEPIIRQVDNYTWVAVRMGGMGVAIGSLVGKEVAGML